jgi:archaellin
MMLREVKEEDFVSTIRNNIDNNFSAEEKTLYAEKVDTFLGCFKGGSNLKKGSVITIDFLPETGMVVGLDEQVFEPIAGEDFYHTVLRLWIGKPLQASIKDGLLGSKP